VLVALDLGTAPLFAGSHPYMHLAVDESQGAALGCLNCFGGEGIASGALEP
jgi:hypothetical protein